MRENMQCVSSVRQRYTMMLVTYNSLKNNFYTNVSYHSYSVQLFHQCMPYHVESNICLVKHYNYTMFDKHSYKNKNWNQKLHLEYAYGYDTMFFFIHFTQTIFVNNVIYKLRKRWRHSSLFSSVNSNFHMYIYKSTKTNKNLL